MRFFLSSATHDMIEEELSQLKHHKISQPTPTIPLSEDRDNLIYSQTREKDDGPEVVPSSKKKTAPNQEEQAAPMSTNVDLSIPGASTQYLHCNSKSCCSDAGCSNFGRANHEVHRQKADSWGCTH